MGAQTNALATTEVTTSQQDELLVTPSIPTQDLIIRLGPSFTAILPTVGDLRIQDKDDTNDSDFVQFKVDDGLGWVEISSPNFFKFLHDLVVKPNAPADVAILIRDSGDAQDNIKVNEDGSIDVRVGVFPLVTLQADLGSAGFTFLNAYIQNLFITALAATGAISCDSLTVGGGYGSTGVSIDTNGNVQMNGKLTVDGAIDPTELDMPDDAPVYYDTAKSKYTKHDSGSGEVKSVGVREFSNIVKMLDELRLIDNKKLYLDTAATKSIRYNSATGEIVLETNLDITNDLKVENDAVVENDLNVQNDLTVDNILDWSANECLVKLYSQAAEPDINDDSMAFWWDTTLTQMWLIVDRGGTQYKVQLN